MVLVRYNSLGVVLAVVSNIWLVIMSLIDNSQTLPCLLTAAVAQSFRAFAAQVESSVFVS